MAKKYRQDNDLEFFKLADNEMLGVLVKYLTEDKDGERRVTEQLTNKEAFKQCNDDYHQVWQLIATELQCFGGDTLVNVFRGGGVSYKEILTDVCDRLSVKYDSQQPTLEIEDLLLQKFFKDSWESMSDEDRNETLGILDVDSSMSQSSAFEYIYQNLGKQGYLTYQVALLVAAAFAQNMIGRSAALGVTQFVAGRTASVFFGPVGIILAGFASLPLISGPAYRVTVPAVVQIAAMRKQLLSKEEGFF
ncbi:DUF3944 domain-containing protein [Pseudoalteromonas sp. T1lg76]|uniref:DUF3944 domain-containing protein n=1 Tax=Pseudoalteromonas sp. T1lg76 TaxID=2077103 RepID=UPI000CF67A86|nr:DUF3944 domain-containing protein [Pseudoalteromonas sp. T1lg76]